jgi:transcriptional repressor NrdR
VKCPYCGHRNDRVIDSRTIKDGAAIRRRRVCGHCRGRFTSYETIEEVQLMVIKKDGRREEFDRAKLRVGIQKACEKRPVPTDRIDQVVEDIETALYRGTNEMPTRNIGEEVMQQLYTLDEVAYVRFASVYRQFKDIGEFMSELKGLLGNRGEVEPAHTKPRAGKKQSPPHTA